VIPRGAGRPRLTEAESRAIRAGVRSAWPLALLAIVAGIATDVPALIPVGLLIGVLAFARGVWLRRGLDGFLYEREVATRHAVWGDRVPLTVRIRNRSLLPVAWLTAEDALSDEVIIRGEHASPVAEDPGGRRWLRNAWTLWPFETVERRFVVQADRRGRVAFGPVTLRAGDLFAGTAAEGRLDLPLELTVAPRTLPVRTGASRARWSTQQRAVAGFPEDPAHVVGVRAYRPGDSPRRIDWRATARTGTPLSKRFEASRERELLLALDIQTMEGATVGAGYDAELVEALCVAAASLARDAIGGGARVGLAAMAYSYRPRTEVRVPPAGGPRQLLALTDALARLSPYASGAFGALLAALPRWLPGHCQVVIVTARDPAPYLPVLRRLRGLGYELLLVGVGSAGPTAAARAREAGLPAITARLDPDWRAAEALDLATGTAAGAAP
jgi:uncharacterized protein (DUF58 family)